MKHVVWAAIGVLLFLSGCNVKGNDPLYTPPAPALKEGLYANTVYGRTSVMDDEEIRQMHQEAREFCHSQNKTLHIEKRKAYSPPVDGEYAFDALYFRCQ